MLSFEDYAAKLFSTYGHCVAMEMSRNSIKLVQTLKLTQSFVFCRTCVDCALSRIGQAQARNVCASHQHRLTMASFAASTFKSTFTASLTSTFTASFTSTFTGGPQPTRTLCVITQSL